MIQGGKVLAIIPARSGSKGIKGKNIIHFCGKPLLKWTIEAAFKCASIDDIAVSTDSKNILTIAEKAGVSLLIHRPEILSTDEASMVDVVIHALDLYPNFEWFVVLQPTSPLRNEFHISESLDHLVKSGSSKVVSVCESKSKPNHIFNLDANTKMLQPLLGWWSLSLPRQALEIFYELNGAIYAGKAKLLKKNRQLVDDKTLAYIMEKSVSLDIDEPEDVRAAQKILESRK